MIRLPSQKVDGVSRVYNNGASHRTSERPHFKTIQSYQM